MMKDQKEFLSIIVRYGLLLILSLGGLWIFYFIFTPLTIYPLYFVLNYFFGATLNRTTIMVMSIPIEIIKACVAGSAYYLLLMFNLSTSNIKINQRLKMIIFSFLIFLMVNLLRIFVLTILYITGSPVFDIIHKLSWYAGSTVLVICVWFYQVKIYSLKNIPFYSDLKFVYAHAFLRKRK